jgi:UDP-N-acetyl-D-mannosaminuronic acid dehydrogenase
MKNTEYDICIIGGGGHIGLPLGIAFALQGERTVLLDVNRAGLDSIMRGVFPFKEDGGEGKLAEALKKNTLFASSDPNVISQSGVIVSVIGTPIDEYLNPRYHDMIRMIDSYMEYFRDGHTLILRSTLFPGTTERVQRHFREVGKDVRVAFCPERIVEGKAFVEMEKLPQIVSAFDEETIELVSTLFQKLTKSSIVRAEPIEAELSKLFCNAWRYIQFAVANQFYMVASEHGLDYYQIYETMTRDYPRMGSLPRAGLAAGPCLLKDTMQLAAFNSGGFTMGQAARLINEGLPNHIIDQLIDTEEDLHEKTIGILGMAFKAESDDSRDSLSYKLWKVAEMRAKSVLCHDVYIEHEKFVSLDTLLEESDIIILAAPHNAYREIDITKYPIKRFVDIWNVWDRTGDVVYSSNIESRKIIK